MLKWVIPTMWAAMRTLAFILQLVGMAGLTGFGIIGLTRLTDRIIEEAEVNEDQA